MKQNLLLITFDQWRGDWANPNNPVVNLPTLSEMASRGVHYTRCYTSSPQCVPARLSWLSGEMPSVFGITRNHDCTVKKEIPSIFRELKKNNYYTQIIGKTHWTSHIGAKDLRENSELYKELGFDDVTDIGGPRALRNIKCNLTEEWQSNNVYDKYVEDLNYRYRQNNGKNAWSSRPTVLPDELYPDNWIADKGIKAIRDLPNDRPWFLWISFVGPHEPFDTPTVWRQRNNINKSIPKCISGKKWIRELDKTTELFKAMKKWDQKFNEAEAKEFREDYADNLRLLDHLLKKIDMATGKRADYGRIKTIVTSDHGEMLGDYGMLYKSTFLEPAIRVPMFIIHPNEERAGEVIKKPTTSTNIIKTTIKCLTNKENDHQSNMEKVVIEFGEERCFIDGNLKLVTNQNNKYLWSTRILKDGREIQIRKKSDKWKVNQVKWEVLIKWATKQNLKLNQKESKYAYCLDKGDGFKSK